MLNWISLSCCKFSTLTLNFYSVTVRKLERERQQEDRNDESTEVLSIGESNSVPAVEEEANDG